MDFFNKMGEGLQNVGKGLTKKTKDFSEVVSLTSQIKESENGIQKLYQVIGQKYYQSSVQGTQLDVSEEIVQIRVLQDKMEADKEQLRQLKGQQLCPNCGAQVDAQAVHCQMCGTALKTAQPPQVEQAEQVYTQPAAQEKVSLSKQEEQEEVKHCPECGAVVSSGAKFCAKCGARQF